MRRKNVFRTVLIITYQLVFTLQANARTIFIDGISPGKTFKIEQGKEMLQRAVGNLGLTPKRREVSYLYKSHLGKEISSKDPEGRAIVPWNGDALDETEVNRVIDATIKTIEIAHDKGEKINIVSHSFGTAIAYNALEILANPEENKERLNKLDIKAKDLKDKRIEINTLITMASPLSGREAFDEDLKTPAKLNVKNWLNYYTDAGDIAGDRINEEGVNFELPGYGSVLEAHGSYFKEHANRIAVDFHISTTAPQEIAEKIFDSKDIMNEMKIKSIISSEQAGKDISNQQASKYADLTYQIPYGKISPPELAKKINDSSRYSERTSQQLLTPVKISFTTTFNGLFTQAADSPGSLGGNHSGTITDGTRTGAGSRLGTFTSGSFSGRTIAETGFTPATHNNVAFSGTSVGTATARGFQEGELKGTMTVTVPAGTQTTTASGDITINTDGSLSMPSYSGPVTVDATGQKVGTLSGSWSQGSTN